MWLFTITVFSFPLQFLLSCIIPFAEQIGVSSFNFYITDNSFSQDDGSTDDGISDEKE